jgi:hypothetical protein
MDEGFIGRHSIEIETTVITRDPESLGLSKHRRVWRFHTYHPWWKRALNYSHYCLWYACYVFNHLHLPMVIKEYPCCCLLKAAPAEIHEEELTDAPT